jgi:hypothetical protein
MINDDLVKCPLCGGFTHVNKPEVVAALNDPKSRQRIESFVTELFNVGTREPARVGVAKEQSKDFNKDVHQWNPNVPVWRRSPKE